MDAFTIKLIAIVCMTLDHVKWFFPNLSNDATIYAGRVAFPLFAFLIGEGYRHTKNLPKYFLRLSIWGVISIIPYNFIKAKVGDEGPLVNVYATLILGLLAIMIYDKLDKKYWLSIPIILMISWAAHTIHADYGWYGVLLVFAFYLLKDKKTLMLLTAIVMATIKMHVQGLELTNPVVWVLIVFSSAVPVVATFFYNGERGFKLKHVFYAFYPVHFVVLEILSRIIK